ncbi:phage major capsid protein [Cysteiniphilum litorale]|uniref:phage major capsid protein n=1 Tax=Cysteiniphilum litorale TaxID=2056700 RepID=UPI003F880BE0
MQNYIKTIKESECLTRDYSLNATHSKIDTEQRTVELSFSSNTPYQRWQDANEVLEHRAGSIDLSRLNNKGALLVNHDWNRQIGVVEHAYIDGDKARAVVKFSKRQEAQDFFQDVQDGIIANVSVGYKVDQAEADHTNKAVRVTKWQPFEISLVSVPADVTVGIGRNTAQSINQETAKLEAVLNHMSTNNPEGERMSNEVSNINHVNKGDVTGVSSAKEAVRSFDEGIKNERERMAKIDSLARKFNQTEFARSYIEEGKSFDQFERDLVEHMQWVQERRERMAKLEGESPKINAVQSCANNIGMSDKETCEFSLSRAVRALVNPFDVKAREAATFEFEASDTAKRKLGINDDSLMIPPDVLQRDFSIATGGSALVPTQLQASSFIDLLRNKSIMMSIARRLSGLRGNVDIPRQVEGSNIYWVGENQDVGEGKVTTDQIHLTPKTLGAYLEVSRMLMINSSLDAETMVRNDLLAAVALGIDTAALYGTGGNHQPLGLTKTAGITSIEYDAVSPSLADYIALETSIALQNTDVANMRYLLNPELRGAAKTTPRLPNSEMTVWEQGNTINGYNVEVTNQIAKNQVIFGDFSQLIIGLWDGLRLTVNPYALDKSGGIRLVVMQSVDFAVRRPESFAIANKKVVV